MTVLWGWTVADSNPGRRQAILPLLQDILTGPGTQPASCSMGDGVPFRVQSGRVVNLTTHLYVLPMLRMSGAIPLLPLYAFMPEQA